MDTNPYSNILNAVKSNESPANPAGTLSPTQQVDNYDYFSKEIMGKGVYLPDLMREIEDLKSQVSELKDHAKSEVDSELFEVMESATKNMATVKEAKRELGDTKSAVIHDLCMKDERYQEAYLKYRKAVKSAYIAYTDKSDGSERRHLDWVGISMGISPSHTMEQYDQFRPQSD